MKAKFFLVGKDDRCTPRQTMAKFSGGVIAMLLLTAAAATRLAPLARGQGEKLLPRGGAPHADAGNISGTMMFRCLFTAHGGSSLFRAWEVGTHTSRHPKRCPHVLTTYVLVCWPKVEHISYLLQTKNAYCEHETA